jgi:hypothetical protein
MSRSVFEITVTLRSPFLFQGLDVAGHGFDASAQRDELGRLIIPGDHLRGHLRHAIAALTGQDSDACKALFGQPSQKGQDDTPERGALLLGDLRHDGGASKVAVYHRVALDDVTGAAEEGSLQLIELPAPIGGEVAFCGRLVLRPTAQAQPVTLLKTALRMIPALGAVKSAGFGEVVPGRYAIAPLIDPPGLAFPEAAGRYAVTVRFDRPLLVNVDRLDNNLFRGATVVPGGAIKGTLAEALRDAGEVKRLDDAFAALPIGHAFPLNAGGVLADRAMPDAMVAVGTDVRFGHRPGVLAALSVNGAPAFPGDWKDAAWAKARAMLGRPGFDATLLSRGRVAITKDGVAAEGKLFVVMPVATAGERWRFVLDTTGAPDALRRSLARELSAGLDGLGRTGARMIVDSVAEVARPDDPPAGEILLLLETPAAITDPTDGATLFEQYCRYFRHVAGATLRECWARQRLAGHYQAFRHRAFDKARYQPFELTEAGAVFLLDAPDPLRIGELLRGGLPPMPFRVPALTWKTCPFMPQNGYGEVSILNPGDAP